MYPVLKLSLDFLAQIPTQSEQNLGQASWSAWKLGSGLDLDFRVGIIFPGLHSTKDNTQGCVLFPGLCMKSESLFE